MLGALRNDALSTSGDGFTLRLSLPWIRSLPLWSLVDLEVTVDGRAESRLRIALAGHEIEPSALADEPGWWFVQDRLVVRGQLDLEPGDHEVGVAFVLIVPYLQAGPDGPLRLPFRFVRMLRLNSSATASTAALDVA